MRPAQILTWGLELQQASGRCEILFVHRKYPGASFVWDTMPLPCLPQPGTERQILDELYGGLLYFLEGRGGA